MCLTWKKLWLCSCLLAISCVRSREEEEDNRMCGYRKRLEAEALTDVGLIWRLGGCEEGREPPIVMKRSPSRAPEQPHQHHDYKVLITGATSSFTLHAPPDNLDSAFDILQVIEMARRFGEIKKKEGEGQRGKQREWCGQGHRASPSDHRPRRPLEPTTFRSNFSSLAEQTAYRKEVLKALLDRFGPLLRPIEGSSSHVEAKNRQEVVGGRSSNAWEVLPLRMSPYSSSSQEWKEQSSRERDPERASFRDNALKTENAFALPRPPNKPHRPGYVKRHPDEEDFEDHDPPNNNKKKVHWKQNHEMTLKPWTNKKAEQTTPGGLLSFLKFWKSPKNTNVTRPALLTNQDQLVENYADLPQFYPQYLLNAFH